MAFNATITVNAGQIPSSQSNFAWLAVTANFPTAAIDGGATSILNGGGNLRCYTDATKTTQIPIEVVTFVTGVSPDIQVWGLSPTLGVGGTVYIEADPVAIAQPAVTDTYGRNAVWADFVAVWHGVVTDSTGNGFTLTEIGFPTKTKNSFGGDAWVLDGSTQYLQNASWTKVTWPFQISGWFTLNSMAATGTYYSQGGTSGSGWDSTLQRPTSREINITGLNSGSNGSGDLLEHKLTTQIDGALRKIYEDGVALPLSMGTDIRNQSPIPFNIFNIGALARGSNDLRFNGVVSEVRVKSSVDSADRESSEYNNQSNSAAFWSTSAWTDSGSGETVAAEPGSYTLTGSDVALTAQRITQADAGSYTLTGSDVGLLAQRSLTAGAGSYTLTGSDVGLLAQRSLTAGAGSYTLTGSDVNLFANRVIVAEEGEYMLTGSAVQLIYSGDTTQVVTKITATFKAVDITPSYAQAWSVNFKDQ